MKGLSALCLLFSLDAVIGLIDGKNLFTLKREGTHGIVVDVVTLVVCLWLGPTLWRLARARALYRARRAWDAHEAGLMSEAERDRVMRDELHDFR